MSSARLAGTDVLTSTLPRDMQHFQTASLSPPRHCTAQLRYSTVKVRYLSLSPSLNSLLSTQGTREREESLLTVPATQG